MSETKKTLASASLLPNNLTRSPNGHLAFAHKSKVVFLPSLGKCVLYKEKGEVNFVKYINSVGGPLLAVGTTTCGIAIYNETHTKIIHKGQSQNSISPDGNSYFQDCASDGKSTVVVAAGSLGILVYQLGKKVLKVNKRIMTHKHPACSITIDTSTGLVFSGDEGGNIVIHSLDIFKEVGRIEGKGHPCNSMAVLGNVLLAGFENGKVLVYDIKAKTNIAELTAHTRSVTSLAVDLAREQFATVSEDSFCNIWGLSRGNKVSSISSMRMTRKLCTGVQFTKKGQVAVTFYDDSKIHFASSND